jgi:hypothetical protein
MPKQYIITIAGEPDDIAEELKQIAELISLGTTVGYNSPIAPVKWQFISKEQAPTKEAVVRS